MSFRSTAGEHDCVVIDGSVVHRKDALKPLSIPGEALDHMKCCSQDLIISLIVGHIVN